MSTFYERMQHAELLAAVYDELAQLKEATLSGHMLPGLKLRRARVIQLEMELTRIMYANLTGLAYIR